jgi:CRP/FNR family cyclic AMP-dependent transcriptional regulator
MENAKQFLFDMLEDEFNDKPGFLLARTLFLFCHFNPAFEMPHDIMQSFIHGLMNDEVRGFSLMYPVMRDDSGNPVAILLNKNKAILDVNFEEKKKEIYKEVAAKNLSDGTGKMYTSSMVEEITSRFRSIMSYNEILEIFIMASAQKRTANWEVSEFTGMLKAIPVFSPLNDHDLYELFTLLRFKLYSPDELILRKGDPGTHLYIVLSGTVEVVGDNDESITFLESGGIFGEMSLLTGAPVVTSIYSRGVTKLATLTSNDFKQVLNKHPVLHAFFYTLLVERAGKTNKKVTVENISTGMSGDVSDIHVVELLQMINISQKTGTVELKLKSVNAEVYFNEGEIVYAKYGELNGRRAIFALLGVTNGQFIYTPGIPSQAEEYEVLGGFMGLVMEGMQRLDEEAAVPA